ncbi:MAG: metallophosphoesterase, partial [bacterium]|nr:metallophosphoesterase [bacterium]
MRILTISDTVERKLYSVKAKERFPNIDLILSCGDLPFYYLEFLVTVLNVPLFYVYGNHHTRPMLTADGGEVTQPGGCVNIDHRILSFHGLLIGGFEGCMRYNNGPKQYTEFEMWWKVQQLKPRLFRNTLLHKRAIDILITHAPPLGIHDKPDLCHHGFKVFRRFIERYRPRYFIHGHTHRYNTRDAWKTQHRHTSVINTCGCRVL